MIESKIIDLSVNAKGAPINVLSFFEGFDKSLDSTCNLKNWDTFVFYVAMSDEFSMVADDCLKNDHCRRVHALAHLY